MSGDVWVAGLNAGLAWWLIHRVRVADRAGRAFGGSRRPCRGGTPRPPGAGPAGSLGWRAAQAPAEQYRRQQIGEEDRQ
jgi:hypothetical protein